jgi:hypothetical protein
MDNDKESAWGLTLLLAVGYFYQFADWLGFIRARSIKLVTNKGSARRSSPPIHFDNVKGSDVVAESGR